MRTRCALVVIIVVCAVVGVACDLPPEGLSTTISTVTGPVDCGGAGVCLLNTSGGTPVPPIELTKLNSCVDTPSQVAGRSHYCRVVEGYDDHTSDPAKFPALRDTRNWRIDVLFGSAEAIAFPTSWDYGASLVMYDGSSYEGCVIEASYPFNPDHSPHSTYLCDYRIRKPVVENTSTGSWNYVLHKAWNWTGYIGNAAECASTLAGVTAGQPITLVMIRGCVDGPA